MNAADLGKLLMWKLVVRFMIAVLVFMRTQQVRTASARELTDNWELETDLKATLGRLNERL